MERFEAIERGGSHVAVFVTGNNVAMAQVKATQMMADDATLRPRFADLTKHPGIYSNGALVKGLRGVRLEAHCKPLPSRFVASLCHAIIADPRRPCASLPDDCGFIFFSETEMIMLDDAAVRARLQVDSTAWSRVRGFCEDKMHMPVVRKSAQEIEALGSEGAIYQVSLLYEWIELSGEALKEAYTATHAAATAVRTRELAHLMGGDGEALLDFKALAAPWPSVDINAKGVNKRNAIVSLCAHLSDATGEVYDMDQVAVFGDAANDLPMFETVDHTSPVAGFIGQRAAVRVAMPGGRCTEPDLVAASNRRSDVYDVLEEAVRLQQAPLQDP